MSTKLIIVFRALFVREILKGDSPVSKIINFMSHKCDLHDSRGVNAVTYLWDNIWRDITKKRPQCDPTQVNVLQFKNRSKKSLLPYTLVKTWNKETFSTNFSCKHSVPERKI